MKKHNYGIKIEWTGNEGQGTRDYRSYNRNHTIIANGKYDAIKGSSDPSFLGDKTKLQPRRSFSFFLIGMSYALVFTSMFSKRHYSNRIF